MRFSWLLAYIFQFYWSTTSCVLHALVLVTQESGRTHLIQSVPLRRRSM